jgi:hypothetical protein
VLSVNRLSTSLHFDRSWELTLLKESDLVMGTQQIPNPGDQFKEVKPGNLGQDSIWKP